MAARPLRVALVTDWYLPRAGGIEMHLDDLARHLGAAGAMVTVYTPVPGPALLNGVHVHRLGEAAPESGGYWFPPAPTADNFRDFLYYLDLLFRPRRHSALHRLRAALQADACDVVHLHLGNSPFAYAATNIVLHLGLPAVVTFHSALGPAEWPVARIATALLGCRKWPGRVVLTGVSSAVADARATLLGTGPVEVLHNGIDTAPWETIRSRRAARTTNTTPRRIELVSTMRLHARKRPADLIRAMAAVQAAAPGTPVRLRIAGDGPLREPLLRAIRQHGLEEQIELCGRVPRTGIAQLLEEADLFLMPSVLESFGIAALEARAAGVPVLARSEAGARDFLTPGADSILASSGTEFDAGLVGYVSDTALRDRLRLGALRPLHGFDWQSAIEKHLALYRRAAGQHHPNS